MPELPIRVVLADDHPVFLAGLSAFLNRQDDIDLVGTAADGHAALEMARRERPGVLVLDLEMPGLSGMEVAEMLRQDPVEVLILSAYQDQDYIFGALEHGAAGYLTKQESLDAILDAVRGVAGGATGWLSDRIAEVTGRRRRRRWRPQLLDPLTPREREVAFQIAKGRSNHEIADGLFISLSTAKKHVNAIYDKLEVPTRPRLVAWMWENGLVTPTDG